MKAALALAFACLLLANGVLGTGGLNKYQPRQGRRLSSLSRHSSVDAYKSSGRKMLALLPGLGGSSSGSSGSSSPSGSSGSTKSSGTSGSSGSSKNASDLVLTTTVAFGDSVVACKKLTSAICSDPEAAGEQIRTAVQAGGSQAQAAVYAIFAADCPDEAAAGDAYGAAIDAVNDGDASKIDQVSSWLSNFAEAADAVGIPVCMSVAVVDMATDEATQTRDFHAKTERKSSSSGKSSPAGKSSTGGSKAGTSGSQAGTDSSKAGTDSSKASTGGR
ncbi:hypothetical protein COHA_006848 [Chlorella ohadii]|uniref:Uncharacterized protein n=1 Tax=Chlorella ohadii TaxID=2649997 RepID=A0AAD5DK25_9CHLO|nr:hypothetical protein COHA_006848 [Chlorella ohadii]